MVSFGVLYWDHYFAVYKWTVTISKQCFLFYLQMIELYNCWNGELGDILDWLSCNKSSFNVPYLIEEITFSTILIFRSIIYQLIGCILYNFQVSVMILGQAEKSRSISDKEFSRHVTIISKASKNIQIVLDYVALFTCMYCNHIGANNYPNNSENLALVRMKFVRIITNYSFIAHNEPLLHVNRFFTVTDLNEYVVGIFMSQWINGNCPQIFKEIYRYRQ